MSNKGPKTTEFPNWDDLLSDYLDQRQQLQKVIDGLRALDGDPASLQYDLEDLQYRIDAVNQMRTAVSQHKAA